MKRGVRTSDQPAAVAERVRVLVGGLLEVIRDL